MSFPGAAAASASSPAPLDADERAELTRLRLQYADLAGRHRKFRLAAWLYAAHQDIDADVVYPTPDAEP